MGGERLVQHFNLVNRFFLDLGGSLGRARLDEALLVLPVLAAFAFRPYFLHGSDESADVGLGIILICLIITGCYQALLRYGRASAMIIVPIIGAGFGVTYSGLISEINSVSVPIEVHAMFLLLGMYLFSLPVLATTILFMVLDVSGLVTFAEAFRRFKLTIVVAWFSLFVAVVLAQSL